jgi:hypothetical protein
MSKRPAPETNDNNAKKPNLDTNPDKPLSTVIIDKRTDIANKAREILLKEMNNIRVELHKSILNETAMGSNSWNGTIALRFGYYIAQVFLDNVAKICADDKIKINLLELNNNIIGDVYIQQVVRISISW